MQLVRVVLFPLHRPVRLDDPLAVSQLHVLHLRWELNGCQGLGVVFLTQLNSEVWKLLEPNAKKFVFIEVFLSKIEPFT